METIINHIIEIVFGVISLIVLFFIKKAYNDAQSKETIQDAKINCIEKLIEETQTNNKESRDVMMNILNILQENDIAMLKDKLYQSCSHYLTVRQMTKDDFMNLTSLYNRYVLTGGNGEVQFLYEKVVKEVKIIEEGVN